MTKEQEQLQAAALGIGQFVIAFYGRAPQGARLEVARLPWATRFDATIRHGDRRYGRGYILEDGMVAAARFPLAVDEGEKMGRRLALAVSDAGRPNESDGEGSGDSGKNG